MANKATYFLIDYENVHEDGLTGANTLGKNDNVHLFTSKNAPNISIKTLTFFNSTNLQCHEVPANKQSVDMNLASFLGYLIAKNDNAKCNYVIISNDTGFDNVMKFWRQRENLSIVRQDKIKASPVILQKESEIVKTAMPDNTPINEPNLQEVNGKQNTANVNLAQLSNKNCQINVEVQKILSKSGFKNNIINDAASLVSKNHSQQNAKQLIYRSFISKFGQQNGLKVYNLIKKLL